MFCPKCGDELIETSSTFLCKDGDMLLSVDLAERLVKCFVTKKEKPKDIRFSFTVGGEWYCPSCSMKTQEKDGYLLCPQCGLSLNEFIQSLVELHPHR